jgi:hypothetical protein
MIIRLLFVFFLLCFANITSYADNRSVKGIKRPVVKSITIEVNTNEREGSSDTPREPCDDFVLNESDILEFFRKATIISQMDHTKTLYASQCFINGTAILKNGREAEWQIDRFRRGTMWFIKSEKFPNIPNDVYFFCGTCRSEKYYEACDVKCALDDLRR